MANKSISKVLEIMKRSFNDGLHNLSKEKRIIIQKRRRGYCELLEKATVIHVPKKIWKFIENFDFLNHITSFDKMAPVPYDNQALLFQPAFPFAKHLLVEYIHVYKYMDERDLLFPLVKDLGFLMPPSTFVPVGDIGMQICIRQKGNFPLLISFVIVDNSLFIHNGDDTKPDWTLFSSELLKDDNYVAFATFTVLGLNTLAFISEPEIAYEWKQKLQRLPKTNGKSKRTKPSGWTKVKIKRTQTVFMEKAEGEKRDWTKPDHQVDVASHIRTLHYCKNCQQFIPLRYMRQEDCPRCKIHPLVTYEKKTVVKSCLRFDDMPSLDKNRDIYLSE